MSRHSPTARSVASLVLLASAVSGVAVTQTENVAGAAAPRTCHDPSVQNELPFIHSAKSGVPGGETTVRASWSSRVKYHGVTGYDLKAARQGQAATKPIVFHMSGGGSVGVEAVVPRGRYRLFVRAIYSSDPGPWTCATRVVRAR